MTKTNSKARTLELLRRRGRYTARDIGNSVGVRDNTAAKNIKLLRDDIDSGVLFGFEIKDRVVPGRGCCEYWIEYGEKKYDALITTCIERRAGYPEGHNQIPKITDQVDGLISRMNPVDQARARAHFGI